MVIKRIGPLSLAKISGTVYAILGLVFGAMFSVASLAGGFGSDTAEGMGLGAMMGIGALFAFPVGYGVLGFVTSLIGAWLYNILASVVGGIELDVQ